MSDVLDYQIDIEETDEAEILAKDLIAKSYHENDPFHPVSGEVKHAKPKKWVILSQDNETLSMAGLHKRRAIVDDSLDTIGGIGNLMTERCSAGKGLARLVMNKAIEELKSDDSISFIMIFCEKEHLPYYASLGWQPFEGKVHIGQSPNYTLFTTLSPMTMALKKAPSRCAAIYLRGDIW